MPVVNPGKGSAGRASGSWRFDVTGGFVPFTAGSSAVDFDDTLTDTNGTTLASHVPSPEGTQWVYHPASATFGAATRPLLINTAGRAYPNFTSFTTCYVAQPAPVGPDYAWEADIFIASKITSYPGLAVRLSPTVATMYYVRINVATDAVELLKYVAGTATSLAGPITIPTLNVGDTRRLRVEVHTGSLTVKVDGVTYITSSDTSVTAVGSGGFTYTGAAGVGAAAGGHHDNPKLIDLSGTEDTGTVPGRTVTPLPGRLNNTYAINNTSFIQDNLWTHTDNVQYAAWADDAKKPRIAKRTLPAGAWSAATDLSAVATNPLVSPIADDPHNTLQVAVSTDGHVHVAGNMHNNALRYARTATPGDLTSFAAAGMTGTSETSLTYPAFVKLNDGTLLCFLRSGISGDGAMLLNKYDAGTGVWSRVATVIDGTALSESPYWNRIVVAPDGTLHVFYCWRGTGTASTNNDLCHIQSTDGGTTWTSRAGGALTLPITHATSPLVVDTAATGSGLLNQNGASVDTANRPHAVYQLYDGGGKTQIWHAYHNGTSWVTEQVTTTLAYTMNLGVAVVDMFVARPACVSGTDGRTFALWRSNPDYPDKIQVTDVTPGQSKKTATVWWAKSYYHEVTPDGGALKNRDELHMLVSPAAPADSANPDFASSLVWGQQKALVVSMPMADLSTLVSNGAVL